MSEDRGDTGEQRTAQAQPAEPSTSVPSGSSGTGEQKTWRARLANQSTPTTSDEGAVWVRIAPSQVVRTVAVALLSAAVVLGALFLLWQVRTIIGWASSPSSWQRYSTRRSTGSSGEGSDAA